VFARRLYSGSGTDGGTDALEAALSTASDELFALLLLSYLDSISSRSADEARTASTAGDGDRFMSPLIAAGTDSGPAPFDDDSDTG
jgi:hypothetical protein